MKVDKEQISTPPDNQPLEAQPAWRQDFPIDTPQDNYIARRDFTKFLVLTSGAFTVGQLIIAGKAAITKNTPAPEGRKIASVSDIPVGGALTFRYPEQHDTCILLRPDESTFIAFSQKCTHLSCAVYYEKEQNRLECPCHQGFFSIADGSVIQGPPQRALPRVTLENKDGQLMAIRMEAESA